MDHNIIRPRKSIRQEKIVSESPPIRRNRVNVTEDNILPNETNSSDTDEYHSDNSGLQNNSPSTQNRSYREYSDRNENARISVDKSFYKKESFSSQEYPTNNCASKNTYSKFWIGPIILTFIMIGYCTGFLNQGNQSNVESRKTCSLDLIRKEFPMEDEHLWKTLTIGIEGILNGEPAVPGVYLFLHSTNSLPKTLILKIAKTAAACFDPSLEPLKLDHKDFTSEEAIKDYGFVVEKYKNKIKEGSSLIVANLNEIPGETARALHAICDTYSPIVKKVLIFMTLFTEDTKGKPNEIAENTLLKLWSANIKRNEYDPLIARVTDQVLRLRSK